MKAWFLIALAWIALVIGAEYFVSGFNDSVHDRLAGKIAADGFVVFLVVGFFRRRAA